MNKSHRCRPSIKIVAGCQLSVVCGKDMREHSRRSNSIWDFRTDN